jgi:hypothetical protein
MCCVSTCRDGKLERSIYDGSRPRKNHSQEAAPLNHTGQTEPVDRSILKSCLSNRLAVQDNGHQAGSSESRVLHRVYPCFLAP